MFVYSVHDVWAQLLAQPLLCHRVTESDWCSLCNICIAATDLGWAPLRLTFYAYILLGQFWALSASAVMQRHLVLFRRFKQKIFE